MTSQEFIQDRGNGQLVFWNRTTDKTNTLERTSSNICKLYAMAAQKLLHIVYSNTGDKHYCVFLFEAHLSLRGRYGILVLKNPKLQPTITTKNNPTPFLRLFPSPECLPFLVKRGKKENWESNDCFANLPEISSSFLVLDHADKLFAHSALNNGRWWL